jgi:septum site-determining protein MinD
MLSIDDIQDILRIHLLGVIPESKEVLHASNNGTPVIHLKNSDISESYLDLVARFLGENKPIRFIDPEKKGFLKRIFGGE